MRRLFLLLCLSLSAWGEPTATRTLTVLPTMDTSDFGLAKPLQNALGVLATDTGMFSVRLSEESLPGFTKNDIAMAFQRTPTDLMSFVYMETGRISIFLFDSSRPSEFVLAFELLTPPDGNLTNTFIEEQFRNTWNSVMAHYMEGKFQPLPGADPDEKSLARTEEQHYKAMEARKLYRELAALDSPNYYAGAAIGMARFSGLNSSTASTMNFGANLGAKVSDRINVELGVDVFSYLLPHLDGRYLLPIANKHVSLSASLGVATVMGNVTSNKGFTSTSLKTGAFLFGPGLSFDIPLLGVNLRGDLRYYLGSGSVLVGTYGIVYAI